MCLSHTHAHSLPHAMHPELPDRCACCPTHLLQHRTPHARQCNVSPTLEGAGKSLGSQLWPLVTRKGWPSPRSLCEQALHRPIQLLPRIELGGQGGLLAGSEPAPSGPWQEADQGNISTRSQRLGQSEDIAERPSNPRGLLGGGEGPRVPPWPEPPISPTPPPTPHPFLGGLLPIFSFSLTFPVTFAAEK